MNRPITAILLVCLAAAVCPPAQGLEATYDISGYEIFGGWEDEFPSFSMSLGVPGRLPKL